MILFLLIMSYLTSKQEKQIRTIRANIARMQNEIDDSNKRFSNWCDAEYQKAINSIYD